MTDRLGRPRVHLRATTSTNDRARALAAAGAPHGTLVTAGAQEAGRGRQGRSWSAPAGSSVLCSIVLRDVPALLTLRAGVATAEVCGPDAQIKWPNDVVLGGRKVCGILAEGRAGAWAVLGIGLNVAVRVEDLPTELRDTAGTLGRTPDDVEPVLTQLLVALDDASALSGDALIAQFGARDALAGQPITWDGGSGTARGIDATGRLLVDTGAGTTALDAGEVHLRAAPPR